MAYTAGNISKAAKTLLGNRLYEDIALDRGQKSVWDLPSYGPMIQGVRDQGARSLADYGRALQETGTTGPAAALSLERVGEGTNNAILNLTNQLRTAREGDVWKGAGIWQQLRQQNLAAQQAREQQEANKMGLMDYLKLGTQMAGVAAAPFTGGLSLPIAGGLSNLLASNWQNLPPEMLKSLGS